MGYQSGAIQYAEHKNISLKVIAEPTEEEIKSHPGIREIHLNVLALCLGEVEVIPEFDVDWILNNTSIKKGDAISYGGMNNEIYVLDSSGKALGSLHFFQNRLPRIPADSVGLVHKESFSDGYLSVPNWPHPPLKIKSITFKYDTYTLSSSSVMRFKILAERVLRDIVTGETHLYKVSAERDGA